MISCSLPFGIVRVYSWSRQLSVRQRTYGDKYWSVCQYIMGNRFWPVTTAAKPLRRLHFCLREIKPDPALFNVLTHNSNDKWPSAQTATLANANVLLAFSRKTCITREKKCGIGCRSGFNLSAAALQYCSSTEPRDRIPSSSYQNRGCNDD